ncbi:MAG: hypothetical protein LC101_05870 [Flavobacteriales bacterium]|nr:hypothetical protein [Flavobacteriales bacterium]
MKSYLKSPWPLLIWFALYAIVAFYFMPIATNRITPYLEDRTIPDLEAGYDFDHIEELMDVMGLEGREAYRQMLLGVDLIYPVIYAMLLATGIVYFLTRTFPSIRLLWLMGIFPFFAMLADYVENFSMVQIISSFPDINPHTVARASSATTLKWGFVFLSLVVLSISLLANLIKRFVFLKKNTSD